ncbi:S-adenosylmethionine tRNA ribosyltransferase [Sulfuricaulis limicola]|uniref:S-adenosylmethionine:tRNA ribosyltransferase-isomerase n=1 Tax=Sulfuricaulis limicola TaxID=1620215 RepID=A0A1B4XF49_9GAMM|nr:tRNA preQ1(34) S-adenosylmethionine ribosyltransferase-isomerase QueA [Sulfuricaulis limicola]BAV33425.1 S-adenosylmethionine tRNA ribosyltransferase [Sulfuricaulis limicola]
MRKSDFNYSLPPELVAQYPASPRSASRLLHLDGASGACRDMKFADLPALLRAGDLLVFNDTCVIPARLLGYKDSGGRIEVLIERLLDVHRVLAQVRSSKPPRPGQKLILDGGATAVVQGREGEFYVLEFEIGVKLKESPLPLKGGEGEGKGEGVDESVTEILDRIGHVPLPPYIARADEGADRERYQTVYARHRGAVAAPTAGLHFDEAMLGRLKEMGVDSAFVTLHVGAGTFQPLRVEDIREHRMHAEYVRVLPGDSDKINSAKKEGRRVVAVGTTVVRALETAARDGRLDPFEGETDIFIYPGYRFQIVDALLTNFHLPGSTLLMLVCAFGGTENVLNAYRHAVEGRYRFYSYGDAMFVD